MTDLTKIEKPFGLLTPEVREALKAWPYDVEFYGLHGWTDKNHLGLMPQFTYRAKPAPREPAVRWMNEYPAGFHRASHETSEDAKRLAAPDAIRTAVKFQEVMENE